MKSKAILVVVMVVCGYVSTGSANAASFHWLGDLPGGSFHSRAYDVSADGLVAVGYAHSGSGSGAFRWENGILTDLGDLPGGSLFSSNAAGVSANGLVAVGYARSASGSEAFRWENGVMTGLGDLPGSGFNSNANSVSADGSVIVGRGHSDAGYGLEEAFRWEDGVMAGLGGLSGNDWRSIAYDVSADGSVVVGWCSFTNGMNDTEAFRWENGVMTGLGSLPGGFYDFKSIATGISADGLVVVGHSSSEVAGSSREAFRWESGVMIGLGDLPGGSFQSWANATSADGSIIVGKSDSGGGSMQAFIWDEHNGMRNLKDVLTNDYGLDLTGWTLEDAQGISDDGLTIVGYGSGPNGTEAWIASFKTCNLALTLLAPNGGETLIGGRPYEIRWTTECIFDMVRVEYSVNGISGWEVIDTVPNTSSYQWQVPAIDSNESSIRVVPVDNTDFADTSDSTFSICTPSLTLLTPNGNERLISGQVCDITWMSECEVENILLEFSTDAGNSWTTVEASTNAGSYQWNVPKINSEDCLMRISDADYPNVSDTSDGLFSVHPSLLTLTTPNGGEALIAGLSYDITWLTEGTAENVRIEYSHNAGNTWTGIATTVNTGSYLWELNGPESHEYLIRISDTDFPNISDTSDSTFTVSTCQDDIVGDINGDCIVNLLDLAMIAQNWLTDGYLRIFLYDLGESPNWAIEGQWEYGQPLGLGGSEAGHSDPDSGSSGSNVYGLNLSGDYTVAVGGPYSLIAGPFDCRSFHDLRLRFARWLNTDGPDYVLCTCAVSNNGSDWQTVWQNESVVTDSAWQILEYDVSMTADNQQVVYFRWTYEILHDRAYPYSGWNIDEIELLGKR